MCPIPTIYRVSSQEFYVAVKHGVRATRVSVLANFVSPMRHERCQRSHRCTHWHRGVCAIGKPASGDNEDKHKADPTTNGCRRRKRTLAWY